MKELFLKRRSEVKNLLEKSKNEAKNQIQVSSAEDPPSAEESLRKVMVIHWPVLKRNPHDQALLGIIMLLLVRTLEYAKKDLRFFDAWNVIFETSAEFFAPEYLNSYLEVIDEQLKRVRS